MDLISAKKSKKLTSLEIVLPLVLLLLHLLYYKAFAHLVADQGENFNYLLSTRLDNIIPLLPIFVVPYTLVALFNPLIAVYCIIKVRGFNAGIFRRLYISIGILTIIAYTIWILFPVKDPSSLQSSSHLDQSLLGKFTLYVYHSIPLWNSFPSFHVLLPWFLYRATQLYAKRYAWLFAWMAVLIAMATVMIKVHYFADVISAIILAEIIYRFVLLKLEGRQAFDKTSRGSFLLVYALLVFFLTIGAIVMLTSGFISL